MKKSKVYFIFFFTIVIFGCSENQIQEQAKKNDIIKDTVPSNLKVKFNILKIDSLLVYESSEGDTNFVILNKFDHLSLQEKSSSTGRNDSEEKFLNIGIFFNIHRKYKLVFFSRENQRTYIFSDFVMENYKTVLEDGQRVNFQMLHSVKINGRKNDGNFILE